MAALAFVYLASRQSYGKRSAVLAFLLLGTNYTFLMYSRLGMQDVPTLAVFIIAWYFWQKGLVTFERKGWQVWCFLAGVLFFVCYTFKNLFLYLLPTPYIALLFYLVLQPRAQIALKHQLWRALGVMSLGTLSAFSLWYTAFYLPHRDIILKWGGFFTKQQMFPSFHIRSLLWNLYSTPFFQYFLKHPAELAGAFLFLLGLYYLLCSEQRSAIHPSDVFLLVWFWADLMFTGIIAYRPTRYFIPIIPPLCVLTARLIDTLANISQIEFPRKLQRLFWGIAVFWLTILLYYFLIYWVYQYIPILNSVFAIVLNKKRRLAASLGGAIVCTSLIQYAAARWRQHTPEYIPYLTKSLAIGLVVLSLGMNGRSYYQWVHNPQYVIPKVGQDLIDQLGANACISGLSASGVAFDTPYKTLPSWLGFVNDKGDPLRQYQVTHLFLADSSMLPERRYYHQKYPAEMEHARLLQRYSIYGTNFNLFSLVEPYVERIRFEKTALVPHSPLTVQISVKNADFRQPRHLNLDWFLYPPKLQEYGRPVCSGQEFETWLEPGQQQTFPISGVLQVQPGQYQLLVGWKQRQEFRYEAEEMEHQIGQSVYDIEAMGNQAMYYSANQTNRQPAFLAYGGVYRDYQPGVCDAVFRIKIAGATIADPVVKLDVAADYSKQILQQRELRGRDFPDSLHYYSIHLPYALPDYTSKVEFRVFAYGTGDVWADEVHLVCQEGVWFPEPIVIQE